MLITYLRPCTHDCRTLINGMKCVYVVPRSAATARGKGAAPNISSDWIHNQLTSWRSNQ